MLETPSTQLEALTLRLIHRSKEAAAPAFTKDSIRYLIKALAYADAGFAREIEDVLVQAGKLALPELVKSLSNSNNTVRSVAAMALIRLGPAAEKAVLDAAQRSSRKVPTWILEFILQELGLPMPAAAKPLLAVQASASA